VRQGDFAGLRRALQLTSALCGGRYNPVIVVEDRERAEAVVRAFRVDLLHVVSDDPDVAAFASEIRYLPGPLLAHGSDVFPGEPGQRFATLLDAYHPLRRYYEAPSTRRSADAPPRRLLWRPDDPLADVLLATLGEYPDAGDFEFDYEQHFATCSQAVPVTLESGDDLPADVFTFVSPLSLSGFNVTTDRGSRWSSQGIFVGDASSFDDLVWYWNLRAARHRLVFFDQRHDERLGPPTHAFLESLRADPPPSAYRDRPIAVWLSEEWLSEESEEPPFNDEPDMRLRLFHDETWEGEWMRPPTVYLGEAHAEAVLSDETPPGLTVPLQDKPFYSDAYFINQSLVVAVRPVFEPLQSRELTLVPPYFPELNPRLGARSFVMPTALRLEPEWLGVVTSAPLPTIPLRFVDNRTLVAAVFSAFGMETEPSNAGLITSRLIRQMDGLWGCGVFKIPGVRRLIKKYQPHQSFTRSGAIEEIRGPLRGKVAEFEGYANLDYFGLGMRRRKPDTVLVELLEKEVFRAGLRFACPNCSLEFWVSLDDVATIARCEFCGHQFNVAPFLRDRDWAYRRTGLFGRDDHQGGGIPVALTLRQLTRILHTRVTAYTTGTNIKFGDGSSCETDFVLIGRDLTEEKPRVVIGECKTGDAITEADVANLLRVARQFPARAAKVFIVFSKLAGFTLEEMALCKALERELPGGVIMLETRELESEFVYERTAKEFEISSTTIRLEDLARGTDGVYFEPRPRQVEGQSPDAPPRGETW
jgi:hypothetical protein